MKKHIVPFALVIILGMNPAIQDIVFYPTVSVWALVFYIIGIFATFWLLGMVLAEWSVLNEFNPIWKELAKDALKGWRESNEIMEKLNQEIEALKGTPGTPAKPPEDVLYVDALGKLVHNKGSETEVLSEEKLEPKKE